MQFSLFCTELAQTFQWPLESYLNSLASQLRFSSNAYILSLYLLGKSKVMTYSLILIIIYKTFWILFATLTLWETIQTENPNQFELARVADLLSYEARMNGLTFLPTLQKVSIWLLVPHHWNLIVYSLISSNFALFFKRRVKLSVTRQMQIGRMKAPKVRDKRNIWTWKVIFVSTLSKLDTCPLIMCYEITAKLTNARNLWIHKI